MKVRIIVRTTFCNGSGERMRRFRRVLLAAQKTNHYGPLLAAAGAGYPRAVASVSNEEEVLTRLPRTLLAEYQAFPNAFENPAAPPPRFPELRFLPDPARRITLLPAEPEHLEKTEILAGPIVLLKQLARKFACGQFAGPPFLRALMPFTGLTHGVLREEDRDLFWEVFQVPIFEQFLTPDGHAAATECEAHESLHIDAESAIIQTDGEDVLMTSLTDLHHPAIRLETGFQGTLWHTPCSCGRPGPRLTDLRPRDARLDAAACAAN